MEEKRHLFCHFWLETFHLFNVLFTQQGITVFFAMFAFQCYEEIIYRNHFQWWSLSVSSVWFQMDFYGMANLWTPTQSYSGLSVAYYELRLFIFLVSFCYHVGWNDLQCFCDNFLHVGYFSTILGDIMSWDYLFFLFLSDKMTYSAFVIISCMSDILIMGCETKFYQLV
jgi:hypothetical protein